MKLLPCPSCGRHVRMKSATCPFCQSALPTEFGAQATNVIVPRIGRAALFAFGATVATNLAACGDTNNGVDAATGNDTGPRTEDASAMSLYGAPAPDAGPSSLDDAGASAVDAGNPAPLYGAPTPDAGPSTDEDAGGNPAPLYGAPAADGGSRIDSDGGGNPAPLYGAPSAEDAGGSSGALYGAPSIDGGR